MAYITKSQRARLKALDTLLILDEDELNYAICTLTMSFLNSREAPLNYRHLNSAIGALECAKQELVARLLLPLEHQKLIDSGDIFSDFIRRHSLREYS